MHRADRRYRLRQAEAIFQYLKNKLRMCGGWFLIGQSIENRCIREDTTFDPRPDRRPDRKSSAFL
jgi:hypothetical protein